MSKNMIACCDAHLCTSNENTTINGEKIKFFQFPSDTKLKEQWESVCKLLSSGKDARSVLLCELHFDESCFNPGNQFKLSTTHKTSERKRKAEQAIELISDDESPKKATMVDPPANTNSSAVKKVNSPCTNNVSEPVIGRPYRLTVQINKINMRPCPRSKKTSQIKISVVNPQIPENHHQCLVCKKVFSAVSALYEHIKEHFTCDICETEFTSMKAYKSHHKIHESSWSEFPYVCHVCKSVFDSIRGIKDHCHIKRQEKNSDQSTTQYCKKCSMTFRNDMTYRRHMNSHVEKLPPTKTSQLQGEKGKNTHLQKVPTAQRTSSAGSTTHVLFSCRVCEKLFSSTKEVDAHSKTHLIQ